MCGWHLLLCDGCSVFVYNLHNCIFMHTIGWYLYVSMISDFWGLGTFKDGRCLLLQNAGLAKQVFCTLTGNNVSRTKDEKKTITISIVFILRLKILLMLGMFCSKTTFLRLMFDPIFRRFSGGDETNSFPVSGSEVNCYCLIENDFLTRWRLYQVRGTMRWAAQSWKSRTLSTSAGSTNTPMARLVA